ncbi:MAG: hypothetical protein PSY14_06325 [bacterium]|nr:hypothetical protein [bacterium]
MGWFDWIGRKEREEKWMAESRRLPAGVDKLDDGDPRWIVSHEFANDEHKNIRFYMAAEKKKVDEKTWTVSMYKTDLKRDDPNQPITAEYAVDFTDDPLEVVRLLSDFDKKYRHSEDFTAIEGHRGTYRPFANQFGIHFDDDGNIMKIEADTRLAKGVFMNRDSIDALFHKQSAKPLDSWQEVHAQIVNSWPAEWSLTETILVPAKVLEPAKPEPAAIEAAEVPAADVKAEIPGPKPPDAWTETEETPAAEKTETTPVAETPAAAEPVEVAPPEPKFDRLLVKRAITLADLAADDAYPEYGFEMGKTLEALKELPKALNDKSVTVVQKERLINAFAKAANVQAQFQYDKGLLAQRLAKATVLIGLLRVGEDVYTEQVVKGKFSPDGMRLVAAFSATINKVAQDNFGLEPERAAKVADVMTKGNDPTGNRLPLEELFAQFPPAAFTAAPASAKPKNDYNSSKFRPSR